MSLGSRGGVEHVSSRCRAHVDVFSSFPRHVFKVPLACRSVLDTCSTSAGHPLHVCWTCTRHLVDMCSASAEQVLDVCSTPALHLLKIYQTTSARQMLDICSTDARQVLDNCSTCARRLLDMCATSLVVGSVANCFCEQLSAWFQPSLQPKPTFPCLSELSRSGKG